MDNIQSMVHDDCKQRLAKDVYQIDQGDFAGLQKAAIDFLTKVEIISDVYERGVKNSQIKNKLKAVYEGMRQETSYTQNIVAMAHDFENAVNRFLGRKIYLSYVKEDGTFLFYDEANIGKLYAQATTNRGRGNISQGKLFDANDLEESLQQSINESIAKRQRVYQSAIQRWEDSKGESYKKKTFYWQLTSRRGFTDPIATKGIIAEGYANTVINEDPSINNTQLESSLSNLWSRYIKNKKDSIAAAVKGDVVLKTDENSGRIQFAIKEGSFSTAMVGQYVNLAYNIQRLKPLTIASLEANLPQLVKLTKATEKIVKSLNEEVEEATNSTIADAVKSGGATFTRS